MVRRSGDRLSRCLRMPPLSRCSLHCLPQGEHPEELLSLFPYWELLLIFTETVILRIISRKALRDFWMLHPDCEQQLKSWYQEAETAAWKGPADIKREYRSASILAGNRVVFNIKGNHYRLIVKVNYAYGMIWIRFVGTHAQYDKIDASII